MKRLRRPILGLSLGTMLALSLVGGAFAASDNHTVPGTPGSPNCVGQSTAFIPQELADQGIYGFANVAAYFDLSVQDGHASIVEYCANVGP